jgi:hypothetical protein
MSLLCRLMVHRWRVWADTAKYQYQECQRCGARRLVTMQREGYQPIDRAWLSGKGRT